MQTPLSRYQADQASADFSVDTAQMEAINHLQRLFDELQDATVKTFSLKRLLVRPQPNNPKGLYLWGGVGRGKTYLMDIFFACLAIKQKQRTHFHRFMRDVHLRLENHQGKHNPLQKVADDLAAQYKVICLDEFFVTDIA